MIRVALIDDDDEIRGLLRLVLSAEPDMVVALDSNDGNRGIAQIRRTGVDVAVVDLEMPSIDGVETTTGLRSLPEPPAVVILTAFDAVDRAVDALRAGASAFLVKTLQPNELPSVIREVAAGRTVLAPAIATGVLSRLAHRPGSADPLTALSAREREIAREVGLGRSNSEIAAALHISPASTRTFVSRILTKLAFQNRTQLAIAAHHAGLLTDEGPRLNQQGRPD